MRTFQWKAGAGTSSRVVLVDGVNYTVGVYVQSNFGSRVQMLVCFCLFCVTYFISCDIISQIVYVRLLAFLLAKKQMEY